MSAAAAPAPPESGSRVAKAVPSGAIVFGSDYRALGVVRSLGRHGVPVVVVAGGDDRLAAHSRYASEVVEWPADQESQLALLSSLAARGVWALYPSSDEAAAFVARHHDWLVGASLTPTTPAWNTFASVYDKQLTHELAKAAGVDHPATIYPKARRDLDVEIAFPAILKPTVKPTFNRFTAAKAWRVDDRAELLRRYDEACELVDPSTLMVQELVGGGGESQLSYAALAEDGEVLHDLVARRTRQYPPDFGRASTFVETIEDPELAEPSRRLIAEARYTGLVEIEYKRDAATGRLLLLDINPRVWGWHTLCGRAGVDFPWLLWQRLCGSATEQTHARTGIRWVRHTTDAPTALREIAGRRLSLRTYLWSIRPGAEGAVFARDDPRPGALEIPQLARTMLRRLRAGDGV
jgi:D-aspartate ligase